MPLIVNYSSDVISINHQTPSETRRVKNLIVDKKEVWNEPQEKTQAVTIITGSNGMVNLNGTITYSGSKSVDIGKYRKNVTVSGFGLGGNSPSVKYTPSTGIAVVTVYAAKANQSVRCTIKYYT